jgi:xylulose-5-phosphate/fructose-6-phosphate phosphoketolase
MHVHGFMEEGSTTTPFDMVVRNRLDRYHLAVDVIDRVPKLGDRVAYAKLAMNNKLSEHKRYIALHGIDMPEIRDWKWPYPSATGAPSPTSRA